MDHQWPVEVVDDKGAAVTGARVCLVAKSAVGVTLFPYTATAATHSDKGAGKYEPTAALVPAEGDWLLIVTASGKSPVVQPLTLKKNGADEFAATAKGGRLATVDVSAATTTVGASKVRVTSFKVKLFPAAEIVAIAGMDYHAKTVGGGTQFHIFARNHAETLRREKSIDAGAVVTIFVTSKIQRITRLQTATGWNDVEVAQLRDPSLRTPPVGGALYQPVAGIDIHIDELYKHLSDVGTARPKSVLHVGIFSHSWPGGPILYDTSERAPYRGAAGRDPMDFDARDKDFNSTNTVGYPKLKDALAPTCRWAIWGCSATTQYRRRTLAANKNRKDAKPDDTFFVVNVDHSSGGDLYTIEERTSELRHRHAMDDQFRNRTFMSAVAKALDVETRGACPGVGSDFVTIDKLELMMINTTTYSGDYEYFKAAFSPDFVPTATKFDQGYVDYNKLRKRAAVANPAFSSEYYELRRERAGGVAQTTLTFWNGKSLIHTTVDVKLKSSAEKDLVTAGKKGHLYVLEDTNPALTEAAYAQEDGACFKMKKSGATWVKDSAL